LKVALTVVSRGPRAPGWTSTLDIQPLHEVDLGSRRIGKMIAARDLLGGGLDALLASTLRVPEGTRFADEVKGLVVATLAPDALVPPARTTKKVVELLGAVHEADTVRD